METKDHSNKKKSRYKKEFKTFIKITSISTGVVLAITGGLAVKKWVLKSYIPENFKAKGCYMSIDKTFNLSSYQKEDYDFVLLNIPDWQKGINTQIDDNLRIINDNNIPLGLFLDSKAQTMLQGETEVLRLLSIVEDKKIDLPIIVNISNLDSDKRIDILKTIINKLTEKEISADKILIGGNEEDLNNLNADFNNYNKYVLSKKEKIMNNEYVGGNIDTGIIKNLNAYLDESYINNSSSVHPEKECIGVDVSSYQGKIDWEEAKNHIDFAFIRLANFQAEEIYLDSKCQFNISECKRLGLPFGIYYFSTATNPTQVKEESLYLLNQLKQMGIKPNDLIYPIYIDIETKTQEELLVNSDKIMVDTIKTFSDIMENNGFIPGIYINESMAKLLDHTDTQRILTYNRWIANYGNNNGYKPFKLVDLAAYEKVNLTVSNNIHQITNQSVVPGIGKHHDSYANETVDLNIDRDQLAFKNTKIHK